MYYSFTAHNIILTYKKIFMKNVPNSSLGNLYREHIQLILDKNIEALLDQYTDDALLISSFTKEPIIYKGRERIKEHMQGILGIDNLETDIVFWAETENPTTLMITEQITMTINGEKSEMRFADSWVLREGKIAIHFAGMVQHPDGSLA
jgi:ketosteroid isomerase-like protein